MAEIALKQRRGALSLMLIVLIVPLLTVLASGVAIARRMNDDVQLARAMRLQVSASLACYDPDLRCQFGLFGVTAASLQKDVYQALVPDRFSSCQVNLTTADSLLAPDRLRGQISRTMKLRLPMLWLDQVLRFTGQSSEQALAESAESSAIFDDWSAKLADMKSTDWPLQQDVLDSSGQLKSLLKENLDLSSTEEQTTLFTQAQHWLDDLTTDESNWLSGELDFESLQIVTTWLDALSTDNQSEVGQKFSFAEYCLAYLTTSVTDFWQGEQKRSLKSLSGQTLAELSQTRPAEVEQIITGQQDVERAKDHVKITLISLRSLISLTAILSDTKEMAILRSEAIALVSALAAVSGVVIEPESVTYLLALSQAFINGRHEVEKLLEGKSVRLLPSCILDLPLELYYADYLRLMLLVLPEETLLKRIGLCIQKTLPATYATSVRIEVQDTNGNWLDVPRSLEFEMAYA